MTGKWNFVVLLVLFFVLFLFYKHSFLNQEGFFVVVVCLFFNCSWAPGPLNVVLVTITNANCSIKQS